MKNLKMIFLLVAAALFTTACSDDDSVTTVPIDTGDLTSVEFNMDVSSFNMEGITRALRPQYSNSGFTIYAFKLNDTSGEYVCNKIINGSSLMYSGNTLSGTIGIPIGMYKFLPVYGVSQSPISVGTVLSDQLLLSQQENVLLPELFLMTGGDTQMTATALREYPMGLTDTANETVSATLHRAVSRVDIMFISAYKDDNGEYVEQVMNREDGLDILSSTGIRTLQLRFTELNQNMNTFGTNINTNIQGPLGSNYTFNLAPDGTHRNRVTIGSATRTSIGATNADGTPFLNYDGITPDDLIFKSAHIGGPYLIPNATTDASNVKLTMVAANAAGETRNINVTGNASLPLLRNYVTLVKIYVISSKTPGTNPDPELPGGDPGDPTTPDPEEGGENTIFDTNVTFAVDLELQWLDSNEVSGELN